MTATTTAVAASATPKYGHLFFERLWRSSGMQGVAFIVIGSLIAGFGPGVGASADSLQAFFAGNTARILIATPILGLGFLNLVWFTQAIRTALADAGLDGWGAAATAASSMMGAMAFALVAIQAVQAYAIAGSGNAAFATGLNDLAWAAFVLWSLPRAMLVMAPSFGFWRAGYISNTQFGLAVGLVILGVLGATTWVSGSVWAADGAFSRIILPVLELIWVVAISRVLGRVPSTTRTGF
jgi:hypothetical protein